MKIFNRTVTILLLAACSNNNIIKNVADVEMEIGKLKTDYDIMASSLVSISYASKFGLKLESTEEIVAKFEVIEERGNVLRNSNMNIFENRLEMMRLINELDALQLEALSVYSIYEDTNASFVDSNFSSLQKSKLCTELNFYDAYLQAESCFYSILDNKSSAKNYLDNIVPNDDVIKENLPSRVMPFVTILAENVEQHEMRWQLIADKLNSIDESDQVRFRLNDKLLELTRSEILLKQSFMTICKSTVNEYLESERILVDYSRGRITLDQLDKEILKEKSLLYFNESANFINNTKYLVLKNSRDTLIQGKSNNYVLKDLIHQKIPNLMNTYKMLLKN